MFRKLALALGATVAIGCRRLIPTSASAHMHGHGHLATARATVGAGASASMRRRPTSPPTATSSKQLVDTPVGPRVRRVTVCN